MAKHNKFDASGPMAGYLYQCRLALYLALQELKKKPNCHVSIEKFDDVTFADETTITGLVQAKHHIGNNEISETGVDFWKTLRIWIDGYVSGAVSKSDTRRTLITNSIAKAGSALEQLRPIDGRNVEEAYEKLKSSASTSLNAVTKLGRDAFLALTKEEALVLLGSIHVIDSAPSLTDVSTEIEGELILLAPSQVENVANELEGWWLRVVAARLSGKVTDLIPVQDIIRKANEIGKSYGPDQLPITPPEEFGEMPSVEQNEDAIYVRQMKLVGVSESTLRRAMSDYFLANSQRSKWARESLLLDGEAAHYDEKLRDKWERFFGEKCDGTESISDEEKVKLGREIFQWAHRQEVQFRNVVEAWITSGSFQALADKLSVGWHPDYQHHLGRKNEEPQ